MLCIVRVFDVVLKRFLLKLYLLVPYPLGSRLLYWLAGLQLVQKTFFARTVQLFTVVTKELDCPDSSTELTRRQVVTSQLDPWRVLKLAHMDDATFQRWVKIENLELLQSKLDAGQGVLIATCHTSMNRSLPMILARGGIKTTLLEGDSYFKKLNVPYGKDLDSIEMRSSDGFYLKILSQAKKVLTSGNVLTMAPDGLQGMGQGEDFPFLGKRRPFFVSFANLALKAGSAVLFCEFEPDCDGHISIRFVDCRDNDSLAMEERAASIAAQYVSHVEHLWRRDISLVHGKHLAYFCSL